MLKARSAHSAGHILQFTIEGGFSNTQCLGGMGDVVMEMFQRSLHRFRLDYIERFEIARLVAQRNAERR